MLNLRVPAGARACMGHQHQQPGSLSCCQAAFTARHRRSVCRHLFRIEDSDSFSVVFVVVVVAVGARVTAVSGVDVFTTGMATLLKPVR